MRLIDRILAAGDDHLSASATVKAQWPLCGTGGADMILAVELIVQSVSAFHHRQKGPGAEPRVGFLVGVKVDASAHTPRTGTLSPRR
jgi:predicted hotdog family 3-hydroxylacyl-ACP dehydratase